MNKIILNDVEFEIESYNKNTYFAGDTINSNASCSLANANVNALNTLAQTTITVLQIQHDDNTIYELENIHAHINSINEYLSGDKMNVNISLTFDNIE